MTKRKKRKIKTYGNSNLGSEVPEDATRCIKTIWSNFTNYQCQRKRGCGKDGLYCKQHDPERIEKKENTKYAKMEEKLKRDKERRLRIQVLLKMAEGLTMKELKKCHITFKIY